MSMYNVFTDIYVYKLCNNLDIVKINFVQKIIDDREIYVITDNVVLIMKEKEGKTDR